MADDEYTKEYAELARDLLDKMREFIRESEPGRALIPLHKAYAVVKTTVDAADPDSEVSQRKRELEDAKRDLAELREESQRRREQNQRRQSETAAESARRQRNHEEYIQSRNLWTEIDRNARKGRILTALGNDALLRREITRRIIEAYPGIRIYENDLVPLLNEMLATGDVEREQEPRGPNCSITAKGGYRWRWRRRVSEMSPALQALEQRLKEA